MKISKKLSFKDFFSSLTPSTIALVALALLFAYSFVRIIHLSQEIRVAREELSKAHALLSEDSQNIESLKKKFSDLNHNFNQLAQLFTTADQTLKSRIGTLEHTTGEISETVGTLEKLKNTDPELLQKYSKVYFLNEHYVPERLVEIDSEYRYSDRSTERIHTAVWPHLKELLDAAKSEGVPLYIKSAYRSFAEQKSLKSRYNVIYGAGTANLFSAEQGYSEHQLGTTVDFITTGLGGELDGFERTQAYQWLQNNAFRYGFILSYPPNNSSYIFEPWHWRFVGIKLATYLHDQNKYFYDLDQREIDEYLISLFD